jgi:hypothetical protein
VSVAVDADGNVGVVWSGFAVHTVAQANFSSDGGKTWLSQPRTFSDDSEDANHPQIVSTGADQFTVIFAQHDTSAGFYYEYARTTTSAGNVWSSFHRVSPAGEHGQYVDTAVGADNVIFATWMSSSGSDNSLKFSKSSDRGLSWSTPIEISTVNSLASWYPEIAVSTSGHIAVTWYRHVGSEWPIFVASSSDSGQSWASETRINSTVGQGMSPQISVNKNGNFLITWRLLASGSYIFSSASDAGSTWSSENQLSSVAGAGDPTTAVTPEGKFLVVWSADQNIISSTSDDGILWSTEVSISGTTRATANYSVASDSTKYSAVAWIQDSASSGGWVPRASGTPIFQSTSPVSLASTGPTLVAPALMPIAVMGLIGGAILVSLAGRNRRVKDQTSGR